MNRHLLRLLSGLGFAAAAALGFAANPPAKPIRIAVLQFSHETVSFLKYDTTIDDFTYEGSPARGEALHREALEWSTTRGSRSGRVAWQFVQDLAGRLGVALKN